jgi:dihydrofolate synthase/folylpolyglutamate synthase
LKQAALTVPAPRILICGSLYLMGDVLRENGTPPV